LKEKKISELVTALYSCEDKIEDDTLILKYGAWSKFEAGIADDVQRLDVKEQTWQVLMDVAQFDV